MPNTPKPDPELEIAQKIHQMVASGTSLARQGRVRAHELFRIAAAGVAVFKGIPLEEARTLLRKSVK